MCFQIGWKRWYCRFGNKLAVSSVVATVKSLSKVVLQLINGLLFTKTFSYGSVLCEALGASPFQRGGGRKREEVDPRLQKHRQEVSQLKVQVATHLLLVHLGSGPSPHCSTNMTVAGAQSQTMLRELPVFKKRTVNQRTLLVLVHTRF